MKILNFGSCNIDYVYSLDHIVQAGETETTSAMSVFAGGKGLNQSIALARAGVQVYHAGCIGEGGDFLRTLLEENGVDTSFLKTVAEKNGHAIIQVSREGENSIFLYPGSNECWQSFRRETFWCCKMRSVSRSTLLRRHTARGCESFSIHLPVTNEFLRWIFRRLLI